MSEFTPKGFSNGQYVDRFLLRDKLYEEDAITMGGVAILNNFPAADAVTVVRCRECRCRDPEDKKCDSGALERAGCIFPVDDDYFCAYGEPKKEGQGDGQA